MKVLVGPGNRSRRRRRGVPLWCGASPWCVRWEARRPDCRAWRGFALQRRLGAGRGVRGRREASRTTRTPREPPGRPLYVNHRRRCRCASATRGAAGQGAAASLRSLPALPLHQHQHAMNPRLVRLLYQTGRHWPGHRLEVVSGYRSPNVAKNPRSPHMKGLACDFRVEGVRTPSCATICAAPSTRWASATTRTRRSSIWTSAKTARPSGSTTPARAIGRSTRRIRRRSAHRAGGYVPPDKIDESWADDSSKDQTPPQTPAPSPTVCAKFPRSPAVSGQVDVTRRIHENHGCFRPALSLGRDDAATSVTSHARGKAKAKGKSGGDEGRAAPRPAAPRSTS